MLEQLWRMYQAWRFGQAMGGSTSSEVCVACDSQDVQEIAPQAYRCLMCGYEGGPGHAAYLAEKKNTALNALTPEAKAKRAQRLFDDAHLQLLSALGTLNSALFSGKLDALNLGGGGYAGTAGEGWEKQQEFVTAVSEVLQAQQMMEEASYLRGRPYPDALRFHEELGFVDASIDRVSDNIFSDLAFLSKAKRSISTVEAMQAWCEAQR